MALNYEINAKLRLEGGGGAFARGMGRLSDRVRSFADRLRGARSIVGGLVRSLIGLGAGYLGFQAISGAVRNAIGGMFSFQREVEATRIGLQSIIAATDGISFEQAASSAQRVWANLAEDALRSTATTQEMFGIFQGIVGPIRAAGQSLETVRQITGSTVAAASALGVDFEQAQRDIGLMVRGTAGMDTRMFALLRSMGLITQTTEEWNRSLTTSERITELQRALGSFDEAAAAYGQSFAGVTSSFRDIVQQLGSELAGPVFEVLSRNIGRLNDAILSNREAISAYLHRAGERAAQALQFVADRAFEAVGFIMDHWDEISARMQEFANQIREHGPQIARMAAAIGTLSTLRTVLAPILSVLSTVIGLFESGGLLAGLFGGGEAAAGAAAGGGGAAAGGAAGASAALGPIAVILAAVAGAALVLWENLQPVMDAFDYFVPVFQAMWEDVQAIGAAFWEVLRPVLKVFGTTLLVMMVPMFLALLTAIRAVLVVLRVLLEVLAWVANAIETYIIDPLVSAIVTIGAAIAGLVGDLLVADENVRGGGGTVAAPRDPRVDRMLDAMEGEQGPTGRTQPFGATPGEQPMTPTARPQTVNNFHRGSVQVRQEFRQADPDRVMVRMVNDIDAQAERRVQSGFAPALTR